MRQLAWAGHGSDHGQRLGGEAEVVPEAELAEAVERPGHRHGHHQGQDLRGHSEGLGTGQAGGSADQESAHAGAGAGYSAVYPLLCRAVVCPHPPPRPLYSRPGNCPAPHNPFFIGKYDPFSLPPSLLMFDTTIAPTF